MKLNIFNEFPKQILHITASQLHEHLGGPSLIHIPGENPQPVLVSVLLHGNEFSGWEAIRQLLNSYQDEPLPRAMVLFIGNTLAAEKGLRMLPEQMDYNRLWKQPQAYPDCEFASQLIDIISGLDLFASIDVHNNTGLNPHYACINYLSATYLNLANMFSRTIVYFQKPDTVFSLHMAEYCPSVTLECGKPGDTEGIQHIQRFVNQCLRLDRLDDISPDPQAYDLFQTVGIVKVPDQVSVGFSEGMNIRIVPGIDHMNFKEQQSGTIWAQVVDPAKHFFQVWDDDGQDVTDEYFCVKNGQVTTAKPVVPSMLTLHSDIIRQDCFCYLMKRIPE